APDVDAAREDIFQRHGRDRQGDDRLDDARRQRKNMQSGEGQRDGVRHGKCGDLLQKRFELWAQEVKPQYKKNVIEAFRDVMLVKADDVIHAHVQERGDGLQHGWRAPTDGGLSGLGRGAFGYQLNGGGVARGEKYLTRQGLAVAFNGYFKNCREVDVG